MRRSWRLAAIAFLALALPASGWVGRRLLSINSHTRDALRLYTELINLAHDRSGAEVTYHDLVYSSIQGMIRALDPHTNFFDTAVYQGIQEKQQTTYYGIGLLVAMRDGRVTVIAPVEGTPGAHLGIQPGDVISTIEGEPTEGLSLDEAVAKLKGPKDSQVHIAIERRGLPRPIEMAVTRAEIPQTTVRLAYLITPTTGYIEVAEFARGTGAEVVAAIDKLRTRGMTRLLLDLRRNGGGALDSAIEMCEELLPEGATIVETRGRTAESFQTYKAGRRPARFDLPLVVLVDGGTASASEIVAGAVQDHDRGLIVGTPSWGKGLVQTVYNLSQGAGLALTTAKYYTPSGRLIQRDFSSYYDYYARTDAGPPETAAKPPPPGQSFKTDLGRQVYGGGGITPDLIVPDDKLSGAEQFLLARDVFVKFAVDYRSGHPIASRDWRPGPELVAAFHDWLVHEQIAAREEVDEALRVAASRDFAVRQIRAEMVNLVFGREAAHRVASESDSQLTAALGQFDRAAALLTRRRELEPSPARPAAGLH